MFESEFQRFDWLRYRIEFYSLNELCNVGFLLNRPMLQRFSRNCRCIVKSIVQIIEYKFEGHELLFGTCFDTLILGYYKPITKIPVDHEGNFRKTLPLYLAFF